MGPFEVVGAPARAVQADDVLEARAGELAHPDLVQAELNPVGRARWPDGHALEVLRGRQASQGHEGDGFHQAEPLLDLLETVGGGLLGAVDGIHERLHVVRELLARDVLEEILQILRRTGVVHPRHLRQSVELRQLGIPAAGGPLCGRDVHASHLLNCE